MASNSKYSVFYCAIANDKHFLEKPVTLSCGHSICKECFNVTDLSSHLSVIKCGICDEINQTDLSKVKESFVIKKLFSTNLAELFSVLEERFYTSIESLKGKKWLKFHIE